ncbi:TetR/AcrR family transcriptional regulator [Natronoglycomyces albus]|uniref:TetR/AcrR family transcriptional regulator n=1 Tax=Natronoglycomyces albus TaxID=2811108 RepID=A0A895XG34_9ACTN|nr:TetR/AcrR family transcriptional regulator [Natronoglycomyces albus]QSB04294.1 TetR/AcrR family transcriptional regulator [Natronoglycomyces albus]
MPVKKAATKKLTVPHRAKATGPKRQARGERRIEQLLDAAAEVFGQVGYSAATTNAIAERAGASPGTLYQFFKNKDQIATALLQRYIGLLKEAHGATFTADLARFPLRDIVEKIVNPMIDFDRTHPAFYALQTAPEFEQRTAEAKRPLQVAMLSRIDRILSALDEDMGEQERQLHGVVSVHLFRGMLPMVMAANHSELPAVRKAVADAIEGYLAKHFG